MRAVIQSGYGHPEQVLSIKQIEPPGPPGPGEVLVEVRAASVNTPDWITVLGVPYALRPILGLSGPRSAVRGSDLAGVVAAVGADVSDLQPGDEVFGSAWTAAFAQGAPGTFGEQVLVPASQLAKKPPRLTFEEAAGAVMSGVTALQALRDVGRVGPGARVLVNGASGGLGVFAVQLAKDLGATVTGVCGPGNVDLVRSLGADQVLDYQREDYTLGGRRYDVILDNVVNHPPWASARALVPGGTLVPNSVGGNRWVGSLPAMALAKLLRPRRWPSVEFRPTRENLIALGERLEAGAVRVVTDSAWPLEEAGAAVARMASRRARGKVVIRL